MVTLRFSVRPLLEWALAAAVTAALVLAVAVCVREARTIQAATPADSPSSLAPPAVPAAIPPGAVSVPLLLLPRHVTLRLGDTAAAVAAALDGQAELTAEIRDRVNHRERVTRAYTTPGMRFFLVFEASDEREDARLTAMYLP
jgi:hypothetical protein